MVKVLAIVLAVAYLLGRTVALQYELKRLTLVLDAIFQASVVALVVIFQPELRKGLALKIGSRFLSDNQGNEEIIPEVVSAATRLAKAKIGALIVLERRDTLKEYVGTGTRLDAEVKGDLLRTVFYPGTPLHDGAVIIQGGRMTAAGCFLPLTDNPAVPKALGTRHRAGIGLSEAEDGIVVIVSEETGAISLAEGGVLHRDLDRDGLVALLERLYLQREDETPAAPPPSESGGPKEQPTERKTRDKTTSRVQPRKVTS
jgi:diadenylate cyclase